MFLCVWDPLPQVVAVVGVEMLWLLSVQHCYSRLKPNSCYPKCLFWVYSWSAVLKTCDHKLKTTLQSCTRGETRTLRIEEISMSVSDQRLSWHRDWPDQGSREHLVNWGIANLDVQGSTAPPLKPHILSSSQQTDKGSGIRKAQGFWKQD